MDIYVCEKCNSPYLLTVPRSLFHTCYMPRPSRPPLSDHPVDFWRRDQALHQTESS
jgi:hypothetical protein